MSKTAVCLLALTLTSPCPEYDILIQKQAVLPAMKKPNADKKLLMAFSSNQQALLAESVLEAALVDYDIIPLPPEFKANCSLALIFPAQDREKVLALLKKAKVSYQGVYSFAG